MSEKKNDFDMKDLGEILDTVSEKIPKLINGLMGTLYSSDSGKKMGQSVGALYKELLDAGIPKEDALQMAKDYMLSLKDFSKFMD